MRKKRTGRETVLMAGVLTVLVLVSLVLLRTAETDSFQYWARVGGVAIMWCIFLLSYTPLRAFANMRVITAKADMAIIVLILIIFFLITLVFFVNALVRGGFIVALLTGLVGLGIFNILREAAAKVRKQTKGNREKTQKTQGGEE
ncbi:MAG: hypothetical protein JXQ75_10965 [Phycisphaerae bacterium]|nr:hypothetical protein [Phycisphaerae bacterium]